MEEINVSNIQSIVLWATFAVGLSFGAISHRTHFCTMGAVADIVNFGDWTRMRMWLVAIAVATLGLQTMSLAGYANLNDTIYLGNQCPGFLALLVASCLVPAWCLPRDVAAKP